MFDAAEGERVAVFRADAGRRDGRGGVLLRRLDAAAAVVQQSAQQPFRRHEQDEPERQHYHVDDEKQPSDSGDRGESAGKLIARDAMIIIIRYAVRKQWRYGKWPPGGTGGGQ